MWVAKLNVWHAHSYVMEKTRKLDARLSACYLNSFLVNGQSFLSRVALVSGPDAEKLIAAFKADARIHVEDVDGRQVYFTIPVTNNFHALVMDRSVFFLKPILAEKGEEFWTVGSHRKADLKRLYEKINALKPKAWAEWVFLKKMRVDLFNPNAFERLSDRQRWAFVHALSSGYYTYPRQTNLKELASRLSVPETTLRIHLRKAEAKLMPALGQALVV
ncbi:helix-turn-helix domain-containing protein [Candidatus Micrarchaeota archaeon]|nr:helix-turn-helix domain-containing protein [Candidatus Micrarchaeota archaeon]